MSAESPQARRGLVDRVLGSWLGPRAEMRRLLEDRPSEATLLSFLMIVALFGFMGRYIDHTAQIHDPSDPAFVAAWEQQYRARAEADPALSPKDPGALTTEQRAGALASAMRDKLARDRLEMAIGSFLIFPLGLYLLSALAHPVLRAAGGAGAPYATRASFVWASVITAPVGLAAQLLIVFAAESGSSRFWVGVAVSATLLFFIAMCLAEAHRFRSGSNVLLGLIGAIATIAAALFVFGAVIL